MYNNTIEFGVIHVHSENSLKDSAASVKSICERAAELGAPAVTLTDHGTLTGIKSFVKAAKKYNIKPIPGVEAYVEEDDDLLHRAHLLLLPKDLTGYTAICKAVTDSNYRLDSKNTPRMNEEILRNRFGVGSPGHGHVIACSACMGGVIAAVLLMNEQIDKDIEKLQKNMRKLYDPNSPQYLKNKELLERYGEEIAAATTKKKELDALAKKTYTKKEKTLKLAEGKPGYAEKKAALDREKAESASAAAEAINLKKEIEKLKAKQKSIREICKNEEKHHDKWWSLNAQIDVLKNSIVPEPEVYTMAQEKAKEFIAIFGEGNFYAELQYHGIPAEAYVMPKIAKIARELNMPLVATNDAHMTTNTEDNIKAMQIMRSLRFNKWSEIREGDRELYIKTDKELADALLKILPEDIVDDAMAGIGDIVNSCNVVFESTPHYPAFATGTQENAVEMLRRLSNEGIEWRYPNREGWTEKHQERMEYELGIIEKLGYCDYLCIVRDFLNYGRLIGKLDLKNPDPRFLADPFNIPLIEELTKDSVGVGIGPGRGSGVGSLVCYLTGITNVDPMKFGLIFERFLNTERVSMPDIDSDLRPDVREWTVKYLEHKYGSKAICRIFTRGTQAARAAIRNCARLLGSEKFDDATTFYSLGDEICKAVPKELNIKLSKCADDLKEKFKNNKNALTIIDNAMLVEDVFTNVGMHAAGIIISDNDDISDYIPLMYIPGKQQFASQLDKVECEEEKLLKMDLLGLRNLAIIDDTVILIKERYGITVEMETIPFEPEVFKNIFADGNTNSVFQFESQGMKEMLRRFKPDCIEDVILLVAAYRPGPMQFLDDIIAVKHGKKKPDYVIPEMSEVLGTTYGYPIYQEQVMEIFNKFAGFSLGESDIIRRYMSKKATEKFMAYKDKFIEGMVARGGAPARVEKFWNQLLDFSQYAFNLSHAAAYAHISYYTAWLKFRYPKEYFCSVMNYTEFKKINGLIGDCRDFGINVLPPDINISAEKFSIYSDSIICGLGNLKGIGNASTGIINERNQNGKFTSFADFVVRARTSSDVIDSLIAAGAFDNFSDSRKALAESTEEYCEILKKIKTKEKELADPDLTEAKRNSRTAALKELYDKINNVRIGDYEDDPLKRLLKEKEIVGSYLSAHPLDSYKKPEALGCTPINKLSSGGYVNAMGIITDLRIVHRKSDGAPMAFFKLEDNTGDIEVCCFSKSYAKNKDLIIEDTVIKIRGKCINDVEYSSEEDKDEEVIKIVLDTAEPIESEKSTIILFVKDSDDWSGNVRQKVLAYHNKNGCPLMVYNFSTRLFSKYKYTVSKSILKNKELRTKQK